jgi:hypothetical protein
MLYSSWYQTCNSCSNDARLRFDHKEFLQCPHYKDTPGGLNERLGRRGAASMSKAYVAARLSIDLHCGRGRVTLSSARIPLRRVRSLIDDSQFGHHYLRRRHRLLRVAGVF